MTTAASIHRGLIYATTLAIVALCSCTQENIAPSIEEPRFGVFGTIVDTAGRPLDSVRVYCLFSWGFVPEPAKKGTVLARLSDVDTFSFRLYQNFPNPFSQSTYLRFSLPRHSDARLTLVDRLDETIKYVYTERLLPGLYQMYLSRLVDSLQLRNGPYNYTLWVNIGGGVNYEATRQMFVISDSGTPNTTTNRFGRYYFDYRHAFVGDTVWYSDDGEYVYPWRLDNTVRLLFTRRGYVQKVVSVELYPGLLLRQDVVLQREIREDTR